MNNKSIDFLEYITSDGTSSKSDADMLDINDIIKLIDNDGIQGGNNAQEQDNQKINNTEEDNTEEDNTEEVNNTEKINETEKIGEENTVSQNIEEGENEGETSNEGETEDKGDVDNEKKEDEIIDEKGEEKNNDGGEDIDMYIDDEIYKRYEEAVIEADEWKTKYNILEDKYKKVVEELEALKYSDSFSEIPARLRGVVRLYAKIDNEPEIKEQVIQGLADILTELTGKDIFSFLGKNKDLTKLSDLENNGTEIKKQITKGNNNLDEIEILDIVGLD